MKLVLSTSMSLIVVYLLMQPCQTFIVREVLVNEPVTFPCTCSGNQSEVLWTRFIPRKADIATCHSQTCRIEQRCLRRFSVSGDASRGNFSMRISSVVYNDAGSYRCTCDKAVATEVKLRVYVPTVIKAIEGENITLPCYGLTHQSVKDVKWMKAGRLFLLFIHNRSVTHEEASADRFMMSVEGFQDGDLSLHINSVQQSDAGFYQCLIHDEAYEGDPRAVLLKVEGIQPLTTTCNEVVILAVLLGLVGFIDITGAIFYIVRRCRKSRVQKNKEEQRFLQPNQEQ
ncbi:uncharacterized protein LOC131342361 isoform X1 [Hemibagrus wyckioides]|uniref:uncharacterized protein LOC131342361 isoform X1 n=1 Tax=Hemibagrus wyckioides TaxID=337641 RepID=UPI00266DC50F|nr:uncharacterized protein LOC131342361 isoform X1 [Hemibagrus wyckioides]